MPFVIDPPPAPSLPPPSDESSDLWEILYEAFGYMRDFDPDNGYALQKICEAWCAPLQRPYDVVRYRADQPAPFAVLFDPDQCPAWLLPYAVQWVGVVPTQEMSEAQLREEFRQPAGWARGRPESIKTAIRRTLASTDAVVILRSNTPEVGHHYIRTLLSETPDPARTEAVARAAVPAWEALSYEAIAGVTWEDIEAGWEDFDALTAAFTDFADLADILPTELPEP